MTAVQGASGTDSNDAFGFVKGFITGQVSLLFILLLIVRLLFFRSINPVTVPSASLQKITSTAFKSRGRKSAVPGGSCPDGTSPNVSPDASLPSSSPSDALLLERLFGLDHGTLKQQAFKTGSNEVLVSDESARWVTFLLAKLAVDPIRMHFHQNFNVIRASLQERLAEKLARRHKFLIPPQLKSLSIGSQYPKIESYQVVFDAEREVCSFRAKFAWQDAFGLELESAIGLAGLLELPFSLSVRVKAIHFTAQIQISPSCKVMELSCLPDDNFSIELEVGSLVGHRTKLKDLPKITSILVESLKKVLAETLIAPNCICIPLPEFVVEWQSKSPKHHEPEKALSNDQFPPSHFIMSDRVPADASTDPSASCGASIVSDESELLEIDPGSQDSMGLLDSIGFFDSHTNDFSLEDEVETDALLSCNATHK